MPRSALCIVTVAVVVAGCGGTATVDRAQVEKQARTALTKSVGQQAPAAACPGDLELKVGTTMRCHMDFPENKRLGITVKVTSVDGSDGKLGFVADDALSETP
jgi:hypothetical protein